MGFQFLATECFNNDGAYTELSALLQDTSTDCRKFNYLGVGYGIGTLIVETGCDLNRSAEIALKVKKIITKLNECIIVDILELENIVNKVVKFDARIINRDFSHVGNSHCLNTLIGFDMIFSLDEAIKVNENFGNFLRCLGASRSGLSKLVTETFNS